MSDTTNGLATDSPATAGRGQAGPRPRRVQLHTADDTLAFGRLLGGVLAAGDLVILSGALGAGKTVLTKGIAAGMGVRGQVTSPTFVIARVHRPGDPGRPGLIHVDAYRLSGPLEIDDLDLDTDLTAGVVVVEWGEGRAEQLADDHLLIRLDRHPDDTRTAELIGTGRSWADRIAGLPGLTGR
jgi:tRNA threonylcarbamoyladenosine biosynthesis protein TsaE